MYLKSIEVLGFKSFAQRIVFEFHNGITGIVGPNGSGKSNVADAVRWVLGEQSAKQLRGGNMQDVIFQGTQSRKPLSYASVAITLDNSDRKLPVDYQEVTVTRRLYRSGESEYLLNGASCRLRDIQELFYDTGIGKEGYSIIGQGQIDKILSGRPEERRELFDEAAGIVKFKRRKLSALKKLEEEKKNLTRVTDILGELTGRLEPLERQAEVARVYLSKRERLKSMDVNLFLLESARIQEELEQIGARLSLAQENLSKSQEAFARTGAEYERIEAGLEALNNRIEENRRKSQEDALKQQELESGIRLLKEQIHGSSQNQEHFNKRLWSIEGDCARHRKAQKGYEEEKELLRVQRRENAKRLSEAEQSMQRLMDEIQACMQAVEEGKSEIIELLNSRADTQGNAQRFQTMKEQTAIRRASLNQRGLSLKAEEEQNKRSLDEARGQYQAFSENIQSMEREEKRLNAEIQTLQETIHDLSERAQEAQSAYHREASRLESLRNLTERYDGYGNSIRRVMEQRERVSGIRGVVADLIQVDKDYEIAIETALGGSIQNIVTDNEQTAKQMIEFLKKNKFGRATFLPLTAVTGRTDGNIRQALKEPGVIGIASDLVKTAKEYEGLAKYLLGRILVVEHMDRAIAIARKYRYTIRMVTVEGELLNVGGSMTGGAFKNNSNLLGRRREIQELEQKVRDLMKNLAALQKNLEECRTRRQSFRDRSSEIREKLQEAYIRQNTLKVTMNQFESREQEIKDSFAEVAREQQDIRQQQRELDTHDAAIQKELEESSRDEKELNAFIEERQKQLSKYRAEEAALTKELEEIRMEASALQQKASFQNENAERIRTELQALLAEKKELEEGLAICGEEIAGKEEEIQTARNILEKSRIETQRAAKALESLLKEREEMNSSHKVFFQKRDALSSEVSLLDKESFRLRSQMEKLDESREKLISYMWEEYEVTPNNALSYRKEEYQDREELRRQIASEREAIKRLGTVNVNAIEEYKEVSERHAFLTAQYEDLVKAEATLEDIITELEEGMRRQFTEKFQEIRREFDRVFQELFGGGRGSLELSDGEDILEAGINIISQPPGKKLQNMMQLSGGEKALTAIALLFAIQSLKPSPFCLLDEIEAALDDSNVGRFAGYLQKLTKNTQFIIITHRRGTMNAADRLYGITMQEKGVSTLVSVDLVESSLTK